MNNIKNPHKLKTLIANDSRQELKFCVPTFSFPPISSTSRLHTCRDHPSVHIISPKRDLITIDKHIPEFFSLRAVSLELLYMTYDRV